jgi:hypothetical protein
MNLGNLCAAAASNGGAKQGGQLVMGQITIAK